MTLVCSRRLGDYIDPSKLGPEEFHEPMAAKPFLTRMRILAGAAWSFAFKIGPRFLARHSMGHVEPIAEKVRELDTA